MNTVASIEVTATGLMHFLQDTIRRATQHMRLSHTGFSLLVFSFQVPAEREREMNEVLEKLCITLKGLYAGFDIQLWFESYGQQLFLELRDVGESKRGSDVAEKPLGILFVPMM